MSNVIAVIISDVHFNIQNLEVADKAMRMAIDHANSLNVRLIVAGDLHDTKANMRAECVNALVKTFRYARFEKNVQIYLMIGNHDKINEKSEEHSLNFLAPWCHIVDSWDSWKNLHLVPYYSDPDKLRESIAHEEPEKSDILIMHQGITGSKSGEYIRDHSAITKEDVSGLRIISGHYHTRQTIALPDGGKWDYIGNPYTLGFGEANDPEKGYQLLYDDGSLEFVPTNLRKHIVIKHDLDTGESDWSSGPAFRTGDRNDLIWVKVTGSREKCSSLDKVELLKDLGIPQDVRFELIQYDIDKQMTQYDTNSTPAEILDAYVDTITLPHDYKDKIKNLWKDLIK